jgi:hypothetical protein
MIGLMTGVILAGVSLASGSSAQAPAAPAPTPAGEVAPQKLTEWTLAKKRELQNYALEIYQRMTVAKFPRIDSMKAVIIPKAGGSRTEYEGTWINSDPKDFLIGWKGGTLDVDSDGTEDLILQNYSGGGHCCYNYVIYSLKTPLKKLADLPMKDCGEKISLEDLNGDKIPEIITCNPEFTYLGEIPYSESPFPPAIYALRNGEYLRADREFQQVFQNDIHAQRDSLAKAYRPASVLQIVTDYLLLGDEVSAWRELDGLYRGNDKDAVKAELAKRLGLKSPAPVSTN